MPQFLYKLRVLIALIVISFSAYAQAPNLLNYQGVARNAVGNPLPNQTMNLRLSVHNLTASGATVYTETRVVKTNLGGLFSVQIGSTGSSSTTGTIDGVNWLSGDKYLQVEIDPASNNNYMNMGTVQLVSVPYAFSAGTAGNSATVTTNANLTGAVTSIGNATSIAASPALTGVPTAPTAAPGTNTNQIATTEFVKAAALTGPTGADGAAGAIGPQGIQGIQGLTGSVANVAAISGTSTANGASITSGELSLAPADAINGGIVTTGAQIFAGAKTFNTIIIGSINGNATTAGTATKLATARNINGVAFDGSSDVTIPATGAVPYTGATQGVDLGAYDLKVNGLTVGLGPNAISSNTVLGNNAFSANVSGSDNTVMGKSALRSNTTGSYNTATGVNVLYSNTAGDFNTATGRDALFANLTGNYNTANGYASLASNTGGQFNTALGESALFANTVGNYNTATGLYALRSNATGSNNTALGYNADVASDALTNATAVGAGAIVLASDNIQLGNTSVTNVKTSGTLTAGAVTYPNVHNTTAGQVLTTNASGVASWTTPATGLPSSGNTTGDMLFWNGSAWVKVAAGSNGQNLTFYNGAPIWVGALSYSYAGATAYANTVLNPKTGKIWMDRNLGASQVATISTDADSFGDLYQWGRGADGHQSRTSGTTTTLSGLDQPGNNSFIVSPNSPYDWRSSQNNALWQGVNGVNNPCPAGYRIPTEAEWNAERSSWTSQNAAGAFTSPLKLPLANFRGASGILYNLGLGFYWSSSVNTIFVKLLYFEASSSFISSDYHAAGFSVRCLKD